MNGWATVTTAKTAPRVPKPKTTKQPLQSVVDGSTTLMRKETNSIAISISRTKGVRRLMLMVWIVDPILHFWEIKRSSNNARI